MRREATLQEVWLHLDLSWLPSKSLGRVGLRRSVLSIAHSHAGSSQAKAPPLPEELKPLNNKYQGKRREWMQRLPISKVKEGISIKEETAPNGLPQQKRKRQSCILCFLVLKARHGL